MRIRRVTAALAGAALMVSEPGLVSYQAAAQSIVKSGGKIAGVRIAAVQTPPLPLNSATPISALASKGGASGFYPLAVGGQSSQAAAVVASQEASLNEAGASAEADSGLGVNIQQVTGAKTEASVTDLQAEILPALSAGGPAKNTRKEQAVFGGLQAVLLRQMSWPRVFDFQRLGATNGEPVFRDPWTAYWPESARAKDKKPDLAPSGREPTKSPGRPATQEELEAIADRLLAREPLDDTQRAELAGLIRLASEKNPPDIRLLADTALLSLYDPRVKTMATAALRGFPSNSDALLALEKETLASSMGLPLAEIERFNAERPEMARRLKRTLAAYAAPASAAQASFGAAFAAGGAAKWSVFAQVDAGKGKAGAAKAQTGNFTLPDMVIVGGMLLFTYLAIALRGSSKARALGLLAVVAGGVLVAMPHLAALAPWAAPAAAILGVWMMSRIARAFLRGQEAGLATELKDWMADLSAEDLAEIKAVILRSSWDALSLAHEGRAAASAQPLDEKIQTRLSGESRRIVSRTLAAGAEKWAQAFLEQLSQKIGRLAGEIPDPGAYRIAVIRLTNRIKEWARNAQKKFQFDEAGVQPDAAQPFLFGRELSRSLKPGQRLEEKLALELGVGGLGLNQEGVRKTVAELIRSGHLASFSRGKRVYTDLPSRLKEAGFSRMYKESVESAMNAVGLLNSDATDNVGHFVARNAVALHYLDQALRRYDDYAQDSSGGEAEYINELEVLRKNAALEVLGDLLRQEEHFLSLGEQTAPVAQDRQALEKFLAWLRESYFELDSKGTVSLRAPALDAQTRKWLREWAQEFYPESFASYGAGPNNTVVYGMRVLKRFLETREL